MTCQNIWKITLAIWSCLMSVEILFICFSSLYSWFLDRVALMNNIYLLICMVLFMSFDNEWCTILLILVCHMGLFQKISKQEGGGVEDILFWNPPGIFHFFTWPLKFPDKTKLNPWIFHKIVLDPLEILRPKTKTPGNSTLFFLGQPWTFHFIFN